jgi:glycosyltransferase involved in cell wall biosynthesis
MPFMQNENNWPYSIILPAHNEEKFIENALQSIVQQTYLPKEVIVVNDNSTDSTEEIVRGFVLKYPFIQMIHSESTQTTHEPGSKIVHAFYKGFEKLSSDWDVIVKLDADVILPPNYFQEIIQEFQRNPTIGIAGGLAMIEQKGEWIFEKIGNKKQVRGPFKAYSKACFEKIGGLKRSIGWDTVDELLAKYYGFEVKVREDLHIKLQKPTGTDYKKIHNLKTGQGFYKMDYGFFISLIAAAKLAWNKKSFLAFSSTIKGYFELAINSSEKLVNKEEGKFIRSYRWSGILKAFVNRN